MKLTSITLIAAALAAIAGSVIAAPHPIDGQYPQSAAALTPAALTTNEEAEPLPTYQRHEPPPPAYEDPQAHPQQERPPPTSGTIQATVDESRHAETAARHGQARNAHLLAIEHLARFRGHGPTDPRAREHQREADAHRVRQQQHLHAARPLRVNERRNGNQAQGSARHEQSMNAHLLATEHLVRVHGPTAPRAGEHLRQVDAHRVMLQHLHAARMFNERRNGNQALGCQRRPFSRP